MRTKLLLILALVISSVTFASAQQYREVIHLNNGSVIKGTIIEQVPNQTYKIETSDGSQFVYKWDEVTKITKEVATSTASTAVKYQGEVFTGFGIGTGTFAMDRFYLHTIQGARISKHFSAGLGIGLNMIMPYEFSYNLPELFLPIYVNFKGYLPVSDKSSLFASFDIGGSFGITEGVTGLKGLLVTPAIGASINNKVNVSLSYEVQTVSDVIASININALVIKVGYMF